MSTQVNGPSNVGERSPGSSGDFFQSVHERRLEDSCSVSVSVGPTPLDFETLIPKKEFTHGEKIWIEVNIRNHAKGRGGNDAKGKILAHTSLHVSFHGCAQMASTVCPKWDPYSLPAGNFDGSDEWEGDDRVELKGSSTDAIL